MSKRFDEMQEIADDMAGVKEFFSELYDSLERVLCDMSEIIERLEDLIEDEEDEGGR